MSRKRLRLLITGQVQGVGFRPYVWTCAHAESLTGFVRNDSRGVTIEVEGELARIERFRAQLVANLPPLAVVDSMDASMIPPIGDVGFVILESSVINSASTPIAPDVSLCDDCLSELFDPGDRRYRYPFVNCTNCGPRFSIVLDIPYDRSLTTMRSFSMCEACQSEYDDPSNRRFHAQPNACGECGPEIWFVRDVSRVTEQPMLDAVCGEKAIDAFSMAMRQGEIVAAKGIGGFHLVCDAYNADAIQRLRQRKGRVDKPFAIMVRDLEAAHELAELTPTECSSLTSVQRPIVLVRKRSCPETVTMLESVAPDNNFVGVMLPYSPLHYLLVEQQRALVMTSGNISDEPIVHTNEVAARHLSSLADAFLLHNRDIHSVCDDSIVRCVQDRLLPIRRSRGFAPMPIRLPDKGPSVLAVGGELKGTFCLTKENYAYMSQHIGDVGNLETLESLQRNVEHFLRLYRVNPTCIVADRHPGYLSHQWAKKFAQEQGITFVSVQHHCAHALALLCEHPALGEDKILACCLDGTGYGDDGAIWGGEFLLANSSECQRWAHLRYFELPGGDASIKRPYRIALALLHHAGLDWHEHLEPVQYCPPQELSILRTQLEKRLHCVVTSSVGRLFDGVASLIGAQHLATYEAQAAMELEALAEQAIDAEPTSGYPFKLTDGCPIRIESQPVLKKIYEDLDHNVSRSIIAARFHRAVAELIRDLAIRAREDHAIRHVGLTGGVFQNAVLARVTEELLREAGFEVVTHSIVPPNDGGLALGQACFARQRLQSSS